MRARPFSRIRRVNVVARVFLSWFPRLSWVECPLAALWLRHVFMRLFLGVIVWRVSARGMGVVDREIVREAARHVCVGKSRESGCGGKVQ